jgi:hypothetical protein
MSKSSSSAPKREPKREPRGPVWLQRSLAVLNTPEHGGTGLGGQSPRPAPNSDPLWVAEIPSGIEMIEWGGATKLCWLLHPERKARIWLGHEIVQQPVPKVLSYRFPSSRDLPNPAASQSSRSRSHTIEHPALRFFDAVQSHPQPNPPGWQIRQFLAGMPTPSADQFRCPVFMGLKEVPFGLTETPLFEPNLPARPSLVDWRKTVATRRRSWHASHEFSRSDFTGANGGSTLGAKILMKLARGEHQKQPLPHRLRALALGTIYFAGCELAKLLAHVT